MLLKLVCNFAVDTLHNHCNACIPFLLFFFFSFLTLQMRRYVSRLSMFYKFLCQESTPAEVPSCYLYHTDYRTHIYHPLHLMIPSSYTLFYQKSYFPRTIVDWNNLPVKVIESKCHFTHGWTIIIKCNYN